MKSMFNSVNSSKTSRVLLAGIFLIILLACSGLGETPAPTLEPETFGYCGARLSRLCIVSFGRDAFGDTVVNLFVPLMRYPAFYLNIVRKAGTDVYECTWSKVDETSVYCTGKALNLDEGVEIQLMTRLDDRLLARGTFTVNAFLVTTPKVEETTATQESGFGHVENGSKTEDPESFQSSTATPTDKPSNGKTPTPTHSPSYPNYP